MRQHRYYTFNNLDLWVGRELLCVSSNNVIYICGEIYVVSSINDSEPYEPISYTIASGRKNVFECWELVELNLSITVDFIPKDLLSERELFTYKMSGDLPERFKERIVNI